MSIHEGLSMRKTGEMDCFKRFKTIIIRLNSSDHFKCINKTNSKQDY